MTIDKEAEGIVRQEDKSGLFGCFPGRKLDNLAKIDFAGRLVARLRSSQPDPLFAVQSRQPFQGRRSLVVLGGRRIVTNPLGFPVRWFEQTHGPAGRFAPVRS